MADFKLGFTGEEINQKLAKIDNLASKDEVPKTTSQLTNDSGFVTRDTVPSKTSDLTNDSGFITVNLGQDTGEISKPIEPLKYEDYYFYPLTSADQIILSDGNKLNAEVADLTLLGKENQEAVTSGNIVDVYSDGAMSSKAFPRTRVEAIGDNNGNSLNTLLDNKQNKHITKTIKLIKANWSNFKQTVSVSGVTANNTIFITPAPASFNAYGESGVYCSAQANNSLTFTCSYVPENDLTVNIIILT